MGSGIIVPQWYEQARQAEAQRQAEQKSQQLIEETRGDLIVMRKPNRAERRQAITHRGQQGRRK